MDMYLDGKGPTMLAARLESWWYLMRRAGKSAGEIALMYDRDQSSIQHGLRQLFRYADELGFEVEAATAHELCARLGAAINERFIQGGRATAATGLGVEASAAKRIADEQARDERRRANLGRKRS
jgi:hypothetical protein